LLLVHLFLFPLIFLVGLWISGVRRSVRPARLRQIVRMNVGSPIGVALGAARVIFRPARVWRPVRIAHSAIVRSAVVRTTIWWRIVSASFFRRYHGAGSKSSGFLCRSNRGLAMICRGSQFAIRTRRLYVLDLRCNRGNMAFASSG
jgi:hypothetical protein